jgi:polysaccharide export outer membrane protein
MVNLKSLAGIPARAFVLALSMAVLVPVSVHAQPNAASAKQPGGTEYKIGPGDKLNVFVWGQKDLSAEVPVRPDGKISTPLVEDMVAVGKTPTQLARDIEHVLSEYIRTPHVTVIVEQSVGTFASQIRVLGEVMMPGAVPYRERMTLLDVMLQVGGLTEFAAGNRSKLIRTVDGKRKVFRVRLDKLLNHGDLSQNMPVEPGDVVTVPKALF